MCIRDSCIPALLAAQRPVAEQRRLETSPGPRSLVLLPYRFHRPLLRPLSPLLSFLSDAQSALTGQGIGCCVVEQGIGCCIVGQGIGCCVVGQVAVLFDRAYVVALWDRLLRNGQGRLLRCGTGTGCCVVGQGTGCCVMGQGTGCCVMGQVVALRDRLLRYGTGCCVMGQVAAL